MAEGHGGGGGGGSLTSDLLWFLGILVCLFFLWVMRGGPEKARQKQLTPIINGPVGEQRTAPPTNSQGASSGSSQGPSSGNITVTPI